MFLKAAFKIQIFHALAKLVKAKILSPLWRRACHQSDNKRLWRSLKNILISFRIYEQWTLYRKKRFFFLFSFHNSMSFEFLYSCIKYGKVWIISLRSFHQTWTSYFYKDNVNYFNWQSTITDHWAGPLRSSYMYAISRKIGTFFPHS